MPKSMHAAEEDYPLGMSNMLAVIMHTDMVSSDSCVSFLDLQLYLPCHLHLCLCHGLMQALTSPLAHQNVSHVLMCVQVCLCNLSLAIWFTSTSAS